MLDRLTVRQPVREMDRLTDRRINGQMERKKSRKSDVIIVSQ